LKFGYHTIRWGHQKVARFLPKILNEISAAGFNAFDVNDIDITPFLHNTQGFRDILSEAGLKLIGIYSPGKFIGKSFIDRLIIKAVLKENQWFKRLAKFAATVGCEKLVLGGAFRTKKEIREKDYIILSNTLNNIGKICNQLDVELSFHPVLDSIVGNMQQIAKLCELTDPDLVHLALETGHLYIAGVNLIDLINIYDKRINHVHLKDVKNGRFAEFGKGTIDFPLIMKSLKTINYNGWVIVEDEVNSQGIPLAGLTNRTPFETAKNSKKYLETLEKTT
jgi:inosose dehydratase